MLDARSADLANAYRVLGLGPGVSPLAARRRYRQLIKQWHPDRHPYGSQAQGEATDRTQEINAAYQTLKHAAMRREVPLRRPRPGATPPPRVVPLSTTTAGDRVVSAAATAVLGLLIALSLMPESGVVWIGLPLGLGIAGALLGWRPLELLLQLMWRFV
jgi:hypothetical protein